MEGTQAEQDLPNPGVLDLISTQNELETWYRNFIRGEPPAAFTDSFEVPEGSGITKDYVELLEGKVTELNERLIEKEIISTSEKAYLQKELRKETNGRRGAEMKIEIEVAKNKPSATSTPLRMAREGFPPFASFSTPMASSTMNFQSPGCHPQFVPPSPSTLSAPSSASFEPEVIDLNEENPDEEEIIIDRGSTSSETPVGNTPSGINSARNLSNTSFASTIVLDEEESTIVLEEEESSSSTPEPPNISAATSNALNVCNVAAEENENVPASPTPRAGPSQVGSTPAIFLCKCGKGFQTKKHLELHELTHSKQTLVCTSCSKSFPDEKSLALHKKSHNGSHEETRSVLPTQPRIEPVFIQPRFKFIRNVGTMTPGGNQNPPAEPLQTDETLMAPTPGPSSSPEELTPEADTSTEIPARRSSRINKGTKKHDKNGQCCTTCKSPPKKSKKSASKSLHECQYCMAKFSSLWDIDSHYRMEHPNHTPFTCEICSKSFKSRRGCKDHEKTCQPFVMSLAEDNTDP